MKKTTIGTAALLCLLACGSANACTQADVAAKGAELSRIVQAKMAQDPAAGQAMMMRMQPVMQAYQAKMMAGGAVNYDAVCGQYDELIKQAQ